MEVPIEVSADSANHWTHGAYEVWWLRGNCRIAQGTDLAQCKEAVVWIDRTLENKLIEKERAQNKIIAYLEGDVTLRRHRGNVPTKLTDQTWFGRFYTNGQIRVRSAQVGGEPDTRPEIYRRGMQRRDPAAAGTIRQAQFTTEGEPVTDDDSLPPGMRRVEFYSRGDTPAQARWDPDPNTGGWIGVIDGGVVFNVHGLADGVIDITADRIVVWTPKLQGLQMSSESLQEEGVPLEVYMEGNIVFRQGDRRIFARRMYYDVANRVGTILDAEMLTPLDGHNGLLRLRADVLRQTGKGRYFAQNGFLTSSRMGRPGYRLQAGSIYYEDNASPRFDPMTGRRAVDPETGEQLFDHQQRATTENNFLYLGEVPFFYWPRMSKNLDDSTYFIRRVRLKNDRVLGTQILTNWDGFELLGVDNAPEGTESDISLDYLSDRGFGHGTTLTYGRESFFGLSGPTSGLFDFWGIEDNGTDNLGADRRRLEPEKDYRWRLFWQHRQRLANDMQLSAEVGWIGDRNFLEQYYEREWDELKDESTGVELKRTRDNVSWSVTADARMNSFFTETEWLPRGDHFRLGESLLGDRLTWYEHTSVGYARFQTANAPNDPVADPFTPLLWEGSSRSAERFATRHEIDWPMQLGVVKIVPFGLGELAHWGEDVNGDDVQRFYWQTGIRASMPMWRVDPTIEDRLLNVHGLAHKVVFDAELSLAESNRNIDRFPLYDALDDNSIEAFRRRFESGVPRTARSDRFDSRYYAIRSGMAGSVTAPSTEVADDLLAVRMGIRQRWQTKRGMPGRRRIIDWVVLDTHATWFPKEDRDNFGTSLGLVDYDFRWHVGDRLTLLSDGLFDFFDDGQRVVTVGGFLSRPPRGNLYVGLRLLDGPVRSRILSMSYNYWMSPKWVSSFGMSVDMGGEGNIGQRFGITRIGESLLVSVGFNVDAARDNFGIHFAIEPRFLPKGRLGNVGGTRIPIAGESGLE